MPWNPAQYERFKAQRAQPLRDLLARVEIEAPARIVDLGCGTGTGTVLLAERWPEAEVIGVDRSPTMLEQARERAPGMTFVEADIRTWAEPSDLIFSNAALHWIPDHEGLLTRLVRSLRPGGLLAVQMPYNYANPAHALIWQLSNAPRWAPLLAHLAQGVPVQPLPWYLERLMDDGLEVEGWLTDYCQQMQGPEAVLEWVRGTTLRPHLARLDEASLDAEDFLAELLEGYRAAYPAGPHGSWFPFRRLFFLARQPAPGRGAIESIP